MFIEKKLDINVSVQIQVAIQSAKPCLGIGSVITLAMYIA